MKQKTGARIEWFAALCLFIIFYIANSSNNQAIIVFGSIFIVFLVYALFQRGVFTVHFDGYYLYILVFCAFCYLSAIWAERSSSSIGMGNLLVEIFLGMFVLSLIFKDCINLTAILKVIMWGNYCILGYAVLRYGWGTFIDALQSGMRISNEFLNANVLGMCAAYAVIINLYLLLYVRRNIVDLLMIPAVFVLAVSGSRKALVLLIAGAVAVFIFKSFKKNRFFRSLLIILLIIIVAILAIIILSRVSWFSNTFNRMSDLITLLMGGGSSASSGWLRLQYYKLGWQLFKQNPILGIGIDNARIYTSLIYGHYGHNHYLHCNYVELMACGGIFGSVIYYSIYVYIIYTMIKYRSQRDGEWDICMILIFATLGMDFGKVSYETRGTYVYLLLFWLEAQKLKKGHKTYVETQSNINSTSLKEEAG